VGRGVRIRISAGTLKVASGCGESGGSGEDCLPTTAYLLEGERCSRDCGFCPQARGASSRGDLLARVNWPEIASSVPEREATPGRPFAVGSEEAPAAAFWSGLLRAVDEKRFRRVCFQLTASPQALEKVESEVRRLHALRPALPICVSVAAGDLDEVERVLGWGAERVSIALDAATAEIHRELKGGPFQPRLDLLRDAARRYRGRIGTHLICGLGESERDIVGLMGELIDLDVTVALFAFTPVPGTRLEKRGRPDLRSYRRVQAARFLMAAGYSRPEMMTFDQEGRLLGYGLPWEKAETLLASGEAFRTSGCPDCNRPFYNERAAGPLYNYPRPLTAIEAEEASRQTRPLGLSAGGPRIGDAVDEWPVPGGRAADAAIWRLIIEDQPRSGVLNMAVDEAILLAHLAGATPPTLRFYQWRPAAVSLGYFQDYATEVDSEACRQERVDIVRRITGGRAVLHDQEVTYSLVVNMEQLTGSVVETYLAIARGLVLGLRSLGLRAVLAPEKENSSGGGAGRGDGACFEAPSSYEILADGKKIIGSAQVRRGGVILQHGSIPLWIEAPLLARVLGFPPEAAARIAARAGGIGEAIGPGGLVDLCRAIADGLGGALEVSFAAGDLTATEMAVAERLAREKYACEAWNTKRPEKRPKDEREEG
jgi:biotin synthase-related radical SAM superfamily protein/lipoate-protein ligase A